MIYILKMVYLQLFDSKNYNLTNHPYFKPETYKKNQNAKKNEMKKHLNLFFELQYLHHIHSLEKIKQ